MPDRTPRTVRRRLPAPDLHRSKCSHTRHKLRQVEGLDPLLVPADQAQDHLARLLGWGLPLAAIEQASGCCRGLLRLHRDRAHPRINRQYADAILSVTHRPHPRQRRVLVVGARRRAHALAAIGWPLTWQASRIGMRMKDYSAALTGTLCPYPVWRAVADLYAAHHCMDGPSNRARAWAARRGFATPAQWDGEDIDHPAATSDLDYQRIPGRRRTVAVEDIAWLRSAEGGCLTIDQVAERLGVERDSVVAALRRAAQGRLTPTQVAEIVRRRAEGEPLKTIAADFGVHVSTVSLTARGLYNVTEIEVPA